MDEAYHEPGNNPSPDRPERRGFSRRPVIEAAKEAVLTIDLADLLCGPQRMKKVGDKWVARCPLPDHDDRTPSFTVYPSDRGFFCYGCLHGGDVVTLAQQAWGIDRADVAAAQVLLAFGHDIPPRPPSWYARQARQKPAREKIDEARIAHMRRRVFRVLRPLIDEIDDPDERRAEAEYLWDAAGEIAALIWAGRRAA
jgi:hypothetical protein